MAFARQRLINPRLGTYFSIFAALFAALFLLALIFEQLSVPDGWLRVTLLVVPLVIYAAIGGVVATNDTLSFFAAGRRVPSVYTGLIMSVSSLGGTLLVAGTGAFFFAGFDALVLLIGVLTGFVVMSMAVAPFYRKFGAFSVPSYLGRRFDSRTLRIVSAVVAAVPLVMLLAAELRIGAAAAARLSGWTFPAALLLITTTLIVTVTPGGKRSLTWAGSAQAIAVLLALLAVATTVSVLLTSLPISQLANGPMVRTLVRNETAQGLAQLNVWPLAFGLPPEGLAVLEKPFVQPFGSVGPMAFVLGTLLIAAGIASAPWLLPRVAAASGVYESRKALGWATVFSGVALLTLSSVAVFMRDFALDTVMNERIGPLPQWLTDAAAAGFVKFDVAATRLGFEDLRFNRDSVLFALPTAAGLPQVFSHLLVAAAVAAALLTAGSATAALAAIMGEDVVQGMTWEPGQRVARAWLMRGFIAVAAITGAVLAVLAPADPLRLMFWALAMSGATLFPVLVLSFWWKRLTTLGAIAAVVAGFLGSALAILSAESGVLGLPSMIAGILGLPLSVAAALIVSAVKPGANRHALQMVRDMRVPGGDIIYDREMQRLQLKRHTET